MRVIWAGCAALLWAGCNQDDDRTIPTFEDGILQVGDCEGSIEEGSRTQAEEMYLGLDPVNVFLADREIPGQYAIFTEQQPYLDFMFSVNFATAPITDWSIRQAAAVWYESSGTCGVVLDKYDVRTDDDGVPTVWVTMTDTSLNCNDDCTEPYQMLLVVAFDNDVPGKVCRQVTPGCAAP